MAAEPCEAGALAGDVSQRGLPRPRGHEEGGQGRAGDKARLHDEPGRALPAGSKPFASVLLVRRSRVVTCLRPYSQVSKAGHNGHGGWYGGTLLGPTTGAGGADLTVRTRSRVILGQLVGS